MVMHTFETVVLGACVLVLGVALFLLYRILCEYKRKNDLEATPERIANRAAHTAALVAKAELYEKTGHIIENCVCGLVLDTQRGEEAKDFEIKVTSDAPAETPAPKRKTFTQRRREERDQKFSDFMASIEPTETEEQQATTKESK